MYEHVFIKTYIYIGVGGFQPPEEGSDVRRIACPVNQSFQSSRTSPTIILTPTVNLITPMKKRIPTRITSRPDERAQAPGKAIKDPRIV